MSCFKHNFIRTFVLEPCIKHRLKCFLGCSTPRLVSVNLKRLFATEATESEAGKLAQHELNDFPPEKIRNFSIIAHIDHGKSTLADRLLELTGAISKGCHQNQVLDKLQVERDRGITVKAQSASLFYRRNEEVYLLNLIDTPGHVDFSYEVSRSLRACQGAVLLVDANQGVQAQTVANFYLAFANDLVIVPTLNKIDLKNADPENVAQQMKMLFDINSSDVLQISAKLGTGITSLLEAIIDRVPPPDASRSKPLRALLFDSWYDRYRGAIVLVALKDGTIKVGDSISFYHTKKTYEVKELGILTPEEKPVTHLFAGQVGYIACNMRLAQEAHIGDTIHHSEAVTDPLPDFQQAKPMVFAGVYPMDQSEQPKLRSSLEKLLLNDPSVTINIDSSPALGHGWSLGFLGLLHMEVFTQRLEQEYGADVVLTAPSVPFKVQIHGEKNIRKYGSDIIIVTNPAHLPDSSIIVEFQEPLVVGTIITPDTYLGQIMGLCMEKRGVQLDVKNIDNQRIMMQFKLPLNEIVVDFYDRLKSLSSGFASFDYEDAGYEASSMVKIDFKLNGTLVHELSTIAHSSKARQTSKFICSRLKETIPRQQFQVAVQAVVGGKVLAREDIKAYRKDVTAKLYGGDVTRRMKLLKNQAEGKKRMKMIANIEVPRETFVKVLQR